MEHAACFDAGCRWLLDQRRSPVDPIAADRSAAGPGPTLIVGIGHGLSLRPFSVWLREGKRQIAAGEDGSPLVLGQTWIDAQYLWIDLLDSRRHRESTPFRNLRLIPVDAEPFGPGGDG